MVNLLLATALEWGRHDEIGDCNVFILFKNEC